MGSRFSGKWGNLKSTIAVSGTFNEPQNFSTYQANVLGSWRKVHIKIFHHGTYLAKLRAENQSRDCVVFLLGLEFVQTSDPLLQWCEIIFSFDCHPDGHDCHKDNLPCRQTGEDKKPRGIMQIISPGLMQGEEIKSRTTRHQQCTLDPSMQFASGLSLRLGSVGKDKESTVDMSESWVLNSQLWPPAKYLKFIGLTDVRFQWRYNKIRPNDYPQGVIPIGLVVDYPGDSLKHGLELPVRFTIDGSLSKISYFAKLKNSNRVLPISQDVEVSRQLSNHLGQIFCEGVATIVDMTVESSRSSLGDCTIKVVGDCEGFLSWKPESALAMRKISEDGDRSVWKMRAFLREEVKRFEYKFIKVWPKEGRLFAWEEGENREWTAKGNSDGQVLSSRNWEHQKKFKTTD